LAAYHSKRKTDTLCPVAYTPKKYVRKRKGDPAGAVVVEREKVILVEPQKP
jgi:predicted ribosome quality control (RQC) complex YloA/Tae2 family protein